MRLRTSAWQIHAYLEQMQRTRDQKSDLFRLLSIGSISYNKDIFRVDFIPIRYQPQKWISPHQLVLIIAL